MIRTPIRAEGGITPDEKRRMDAITKKWIGRAFQTGPVNRNELIRAIADLYKSAGLEVPRIVIVPSPLVMAFAYGLSAGWWYKKTATYAATDAATYAATRAATDAATRAATDAATRAATRAATDVATRAATDAATREYKWLYSMAKHFSDGDKSIQKLMFSCINRWTNVYQGGNMWGGFPAYAEAMRDVLSLKGLKVWEKYDAWERCAIYGGFRLMHEKFCLVSEFPVSLKMDERNRPHCTTGPSHRWKDGFEIYYLNGIRMRKEDVMTPAEKLDPKEILKRENVEERRELIRKVGIERMLSVLKNKVLDKKGDYSLLSIELSDQVKDARFLKMLNPSIQIWHLEGVSRECNTVAEAINWRAGDIKTAWEPSRLT